MTTAEEPEQPVDWDNFMSNVEAIERAVQAGTPVTRPTTRPDRVLPESDDIGDLESKVATLADAESDQEKVAALRDLTRWLAQWKF